MSSSRTAKQEHGVSKINCVRCDNAFLLLFALKQCIIKKLLDSVFVISEIIKVSVISLSLRLRLITLTSTLIIPDITKISSNNCLLFSDIPVAVAVVAFINSIIYGYVPGLSEGFILDILKFSLAMS